MFNLDQYLNRARRARKRGEHRKEILSLRQACCINDCDAGLWTMFAACLVRHNRKDEARECFRRAIWLRERSGEIRKANVIKKLIE